MWEAQEKAPLKRSWLLVARQSWLPILHLLQSAAASPPQSKTAHTDNSPPSPSPPRHSHFLSAANSLDLRFPKTLAKSPTTSPPFLLPLSLTLGYFTANPYYVSDRSSILSPPAFYTPPHPAPPATNRNDFMNTFMSNFFEKILDCLLIITTTTKICFLQFWKKKKNCCKNTRAKTLWRKHGAKKSQRRKRLAGHMPRRPLATYQMMS